MLKYENYSACIGFSWLRMKSIVSRCEFYKLLIPLKQGMSLSAFLRKIEHLRYLVKTVALCNVSQCVSRVTGFKTD
jgi:hypothetical protein